MSRIFPFFFQNIVGEGVPLGAAQIKRAVPPLTTPASSGSSRNLSRNTVGGKETQSSSIIQDRNTPGKFSTMKTFLLKKFN
jgi:hypothetical protein